MPHRLSHGKRSTGCVEAERVGAGTARRVRSPGGLERRLMTDEAVSPGIRSDPCGIGELVGAHQRTRRDGRRLVVVRSEGTRIHRLLRVAGLDIAA